MNAAKNHPLKEALYIASLATATPPSSVSQCHAKEVLSRRFADTLTPRSLALLRKLLDHPSIKQRYYAHEDPESILSETPDDRIARFTRWAVDLSAEAATKALALAGLDISDVSGLVVNTCTGYICPGISTYLIERMGLRRTTPVYDLVGSGCGGAIPNIQVAGALLSGLADGVVISISVEICSATFQIGNDLSLLLSNALFGDGAAAVVLWKRPSGLELVASSSYYAPEHRESIRYVHKNGQLHNHLSTKLPGLVKDAAAEVVEALLAPRKLRARDIAHWAIHPGGEKILNAVGDKLGLEESQLRASRKILEHYGNMSSPTALYVLEEIMGNGLNAGELCLMVAFGAGLSAHALLLQKK
jgi:predicted naringenin-chalcone synthase